VGQASLPVEAARSQLRATLAPTLVLLTPLGTWRLESILHSWKSFTANQMQRARSRAGRVWQDESFDRIVRDEVELEQKFNYILSKPWRRWPSLDGYVWVWPSD
jgi:REP-associated tyrosine transposase